MQIDEMKVVKYQVISIDKIDTPEGMPEGDWFCYVIGYGRSKIDGKKPGTLKDVTQHAEAIAEDLNLRSQNKKSVYAPRQNQNKNKPAASTETATTAETDTNSETATAVETKS